MIDVQGLGEQGGGEWGVLGHAFVSRVDYYLRSSIPSEINCTLMAGYFLIPRRVVHLYP